MGQKINQIKPVIYTNAKDVPNTTKVIEAYTSALKELFFVTYPQYKPGQLPNDQLLNNFIAKNKTKEIWIYYPAKKIAVHTVEEDSYFLLRTARNKNLISQSEQKMYRNTTVGIVGLSIGSHVLASLVYTGGPKFIKLADHDSVELTNLNRIFATLLDLGNNKTMVAAQRTWEIDPFAKLSLWEKGVTEKTLEKFILEKPKLDIFIDEFDSLDLKVEAREICRKNKIPVVMATSNGDAIILDVERYDKEPTRPLFHGLIGTITSRDFKYFDYSQWLKLAIQIVGQQNITKKLKLSIQEIGKTIAGVPQIATTVALEGIAVSYAVRMIAYGQIKSGRYFINLEKNIHGR